MTDLPDRLREAAHELYFSKPELLTEAADRIEELEAEIEACPFHA